MRFIQVQYADIVNPYPRTSMEARFTEFIRMNIKAAEMTWNGTYSSVGSAYRNMQRGAKKLGVPVRVITRKGKIYLVRTDM